MSTSVPAPVPSAVPLPLGRLVGVGSVIFFANAALLVLQLVAGRFLAPFVGSSLETWTAVIGVFLTGIALGNAYGGRIADRYPSPRTLALLLALGAVAALWVLVFPLLLGATGAQKVLPLGVRIPVLAAALCLPAGFALSLLTPLAIKLGLPDVSHTGRVAGLIFALSTLGCLLGNYVTGFYLIPEFTINTLVGAAAGVLVVLAGVALVAIKPTAAESAPPALTEETGRRSDNAPQGSGGASPAFPPLPPGRGVGPTDPGTFADIRTAYLIVFLASFCGMALELTASRVLAQMLGVSLFTWTGIIGVMLAGTALGNLTGGQLADRPARTTGWLAGAAAAVLVAGGGLGVAHLLKYPVPQLLGAPLPEDEELAARLDQLRTILAVLVAGAVLTGVVVAWAVRTAADERSFPRRHALAATLCFAGGGTVALLVAFSLITRFELFTTWGPIVKVMAWTFGLFFLPMFVLGLVSPQVIRLAVTDVARAGRVAGRVYAWSTAGAIAGTFATGYVLLSSLGANRVILAAALVLVLASLLVARVWDNNSLLYLFSVAFGGVTGGFILYAFDTHRGYVAWVESNYYTIKVTDVPGANGLPTGRLNLNLDLLLHSTVDPEDPTYLQYTHEYVQVEFVRLARASVADPRVLVIGGGGYTFPRYLNAKLPETRVDVVEIDPKVTQVAYDYLNLQPHPNLNPIHMDGRQFVSERAAPGTYDLVVQDAVNDLSVPAHLMTREYNDAVKRALKPGGVYLLTIIDPIAGGKLWKAAMATMRETFPHVVMLVPDGGGGGYWYKNRHVLVIYGSDRPFSSEAIRAAVDEQAEPLEWTASKAGLVVGPVPMPGAGPALAARLGPAPFAPKVRTTLVDPELLRWFTDKTFEPDQPLNWGQATLENLKPYTDREKGLVLTDQFCPVDNLMADVFRNR
jgi:predicted membrane-bound spermidine synthase